MPDNTITYGAPGIAAFARETWGNVRELRLQDSPATSARRVTLTNAGAELSLPIFSVVSLTGLAVAGSGTSDAIGFLPCPVVIPAAGSIEIDVIVQGYFDFNALNWGASFNTDAKKRDAFVNRPSPVNIILDTNPHTSDGVLA